MLAGENGPGGIDFHDFRLANLLGSLALAMILFDGGLRTRVGQFRVGLWPAVSLATVGVVITALLVGAFASWIFRLDWLGGLLVGAIVASTDAAAVFSLLHARGIELKERVSATLEIESGTNDPMAVFLTISVVELLASGKADLTWSIATTFILEMALGAVGGWVGGRALAWLLNRLSLPPALYPLLAAGGGVFVYGAVALLHGSGFLAIYLAGVVLGNRPIQGEQNILRIHDALAWLAQIGMFLMLGLLATPTQLVEVGPRRSLSRSSSSWSRGRSRFSRVWRRFAFRGATRSLSPGWGCAARCRSSSPRFRCSRTCPTTTSISTPRSSSCWSR